MVHDATIRRNVGAQERLNDDQLTTLARLENVNEPTPWQRGALDALRLSTPVQQERERAEALRDKWSRPSAPTTDPLDDGSVLDKGGKR